MNNYKLKFSFMEVHNKKKVLYPSKSLLCDLKLNLIQTSNKTLIANKNLGQNFLNDIQICDQIALSCGNLNDSFVIEIGPGCGNLTQAILALNNGVEIVMIEKDSRFIFLLEKIKQYYTNSKLSIIEGDALHIDLNHLIINTTKRRYIIANLPYNIGTELLFKWLESEFLKDLTAIVVMLQKEVINRITATCNSKTYSWLSILSQLFCDIEVLYDVPKEAFLPQPKVDSAVISLRPKKYIIKHNLKNLKIICSILFLHRRKTINTIIKRNKQLQELLLGVEHYNIDLNMRPENITIQTFCELSLLNENT